jgi:cell division protein FtsB
VDTRDLMPVYPRGRSLVTRPPLRIAAEGGLSLASAVAGVALDVSSSKLMDRLVRSRGWIVIVAFGLIGIVAMQVSMLRLNAGIGRAVETMSSLERSNASLRAEMSRLSSGERIQSLAGARGYVMPAPADVTFLKAGDLRSDGFRAAKIMHAPDSSIAGSAGSTVVADALAGTTGPAVQTAQTVSGAAGAPMSATATATATPHTTAPVTAAPATIAPGAAAPRATAPSATAPGATATSATAPGPTAPAGTAPAGTAPAGTAPAGTAPAGTAPGGTAAVANGVAATPSPGNVTPRSAQATPPSP